VSFAKWTLDIPARQSVFTLPADLSVGRVNWFLAANEAILASVTALVPNLLGKLLQYSALESKFDIDVDYNEEIRHAGWSQLTAAPAMMTPTVTYLGMMVAYDLGARSFLPPVLVISSSALVVFSGSYIVTLVPTAMFAALLVTSGLNLLTDNLRTAYSELQSREFVLVVLHIGLTATLGMLSAVVLGMLLTATIFIIQYSSHSGVLQSATSLLERSKVARAAPEQDIIEQYGGAPRLRTQTASCPRHADGRGCADDGPSRVDVRKM
jgi:MFS superfamily sulfate permease-like transporter